LRQSLQPSRDLADYPFAHRLRTRFAETDAMGVVHHAAYLPYLEEARVEFLRSIGHPYDQVRADAADGGREFPVLEVWSNTAALFRSMRRSTSRSSSVP
jgi:acyl-CoA thioester hydrolase